MAGPRPLARPRAVWDIVMIALAVVDLLFIGFDLTYITMRPTYLEVAPRIVGLYDPVKGMRPHPTSQALLARMAQARAYFDSLGPGQRADPEVLAEQVRSLRHLSLRILREDSFGHLEQPYHERVMREVVGRDTGFDPVDLGYPAVQRAAVDALWPADQEAVEARLRLPEGPILYALRNNYFRAVELDGEPVDYFSWLELPLLTLFWLDFSIGWALALRRDRGRPWYRYPLRHWYDLLGLLPGKLRLLRLLRIVSIYVRVNQDELEQVRDNAIKRLSSRVAEALVEEVTNRVQVAVVHRLESELAGQAIGSALADSLRRRQSRIVELVIDQLEHLAADPETREHLRQLVSLVTDRALQSRAQRRFALGLTRNVVERVTTNVLDATADALKSEQGHRLLRELMISAGRCARYQPSFQQLQDIVAGVSLEVVHAAGESAERRTWFASHPEASEAEQQAHAETNGSKTGLPMVPPVVSPSSGLG